MDDDDDNDDDDDVSVCLCHLLNVTVCVTMFCVVRVEFSCTDQLISLISVL